jgi:glyoxylase-like metal-dependent hydrolase (beta-lactamase superfamily II)
VALTALAQMPDLSKVEIKVLKVAGAVYMLQGEGGNIGVSVGDDGIVIVDDEYAPLAPKIKAALKGIADKPLRFILNTHWHFDHTSGNEKFGGEAVIIAHDNVRTRLVAGAPARKFASLDLPPVAPAPKVALPVITFDERATVYLNGEEIRAIHVQAGHTDGDSVIVFTKSNVVHMGDDYIVGGFPVIDHSSGGSAVGMVAALEKIIPQLPKDAKVIPGHGPLSTVDDLKKHTASLKEMLATIEAQVKKGKTAEQLKKEQLLKKWDSGQGFIKADLFIDVVCEELIKH